MKFRIFVFIALVALIPTMATADLWSDLKKIAKDAAVETITKKPEPKAEPKPKPKPVVVQPTVTKPKKKAPQVSASDLSKSEVVSLQKCLNQHNYNAGTPDGIVGKKTRNAVKLMFQNSNKTPVTITLDDEELDFCLMLPKPTAAPTTTISTAEAAPKPSTDKKVKPAPKSERLVKKGDIIGLQECLNEKKFDAGVANGSMTQKTIDAAIEFQEAMFESRGLTGQREVAKYPNENVLLGCFFASDFVNPNSAKAKTEAKESAKIHSATNGEMEILTFGEPSLMQWKTEFNNFDGHIVVTTIYTDYYARKAEYYFKFKDSAGREFFTPCTREEMAKRGADPSNTKCETTTGAARWRELEPNISTVSVKCENGADTIKFIRGGVWYSGTVPTTIDKIVRNNSGDYAQVRYKDVCKGMGKLLEVSFTKT